MRLDAHWASFFTSKFPKTGSEMPLHDTEIMLLSWQAPQEFFGAARICFHAFCLSGGSPRFPSFVFYDARIHVDRFVSVRSIERFPMWVDFIGVPINAAKGSPSGCQKRLLWRSSTPRRCRAHLAFASWSLHLAPTQRSAPGEAPRVRRRGRADRGRSSSVTGLAPRSSRAGALGAHRQRARF